MTAKESASPRDSSRYRTTTRLVAGSLLVLLPLLLLSCRPQLQSEKAGASSPSPQAQVHISPIAAPTPIYDHPYSGTGVVRIINQKEGWVEIEHAEIVGLMPAMIMEYWVSDRSILKGIRVGDKVDFSVVDMRKGQYVTKLDKVPRR